MICTKCLKNKKYNNSSWCRQCLNKTYADYKKTKRGLITITYAGQRQRSKRDSNKPLMYTRNELFIWINSQENFQELYDNWVESGYKTDMKPSVDRIDDYKGYTLQNIRLVTTRENIDRYRQDQKNGVNNKRNIAILQIDKNSGEIIKEYYSARQAERETGIYHSNIAAVMSGKKKSSGGYVWRYKERNITSP